MKNEFLKFSSRRILFSAMLASSVIVGGSIPAYAEVHEVHEIMQGIKVEGKVIDTTGEPVIGASILEKGTTNGVITDIDGNFTLNVSSSNATLVISFVGYKTIELPALDKTLQKLVLKEDTEMLDEVVVVGYGVQKKATLTGSVAMVEGDEVLKGRAASNVGTALQGAIPGMTITRSSSRPTENATITIRGGISTNNSDPLILIDGVDAYSWELNQINPNDIESVSVLKDAAASIYGARAAGGVILVTTKRAKEGKLKITYNGSASMNYKGKDYPAATGSEWAKMMLSADYEDRNHPGGASSLWDIIGATREFYEKVADNQAFDWYNKAQGYTYRIDPLNAYIPDFVYGTTWGTSQNITIQGGSENVRTSTSVGYSNDRSLIKVTYDGQKKYNFRNNTDFNIGKYVKLQTNVSYDKKVKDQPSYGIGWGLQDFYIFPLLTQSGQGYYDNFGGNNPLAHLKQGGRDVTNGYMFRGSAKLDVDLSFLSRKLTGLSVSAKASMRQYNSNEKFRSHDVQMYDFYDVAEDGTVLPLSTGNNARLSSKTKNEMLAESNTRALYQVYEYFLNYDRTFDKHHINAMLGNTNELRDNYVTSMWRSNGNVNTGLDDLAAFDTTTDVILNSNTKFGTTDIEIPGTGSYKWAYVSWVGRLNYDYAGKYLLEGTWRRDGSSRLVKKERWQNFFGASLGWRLSEEAFIKDNLSVVSNLKIRGSWGQSGNVSSIGNYDAFATVNSGTTILNGTKVPISSLSITDDSRTWERVESTNIGLDYGFFNNRLSGTFDYFWRKNKGMLINITYPQVYGGKAPSTNSGTYSVHGWELAATWQDKINKDLSYSIGVSLADARTNVDSYTGKNAKTHGVNEIIEGYALNSLWVYQSDGLFQNQAEVDAYYAEMNGNVSGSLLNSLPKGSKDELTPGSVRRVDRNGDNDITTEDLYCYGDVAPHYTFGINLGVTYKNFDFSCFFQGVGQQYNVRNGQMGCAFWSGWTNSNGYFLGRTWTSADNPWYGNNQGNNVYPVMTRNGARNNWNYKHYNDLNVVNSWYVRCKTLSLGYTLPKSFISKAGLENLRVWVAGENLFDISNVKDGFDPEASYKMGTYSGVDVFASTISFGLDLTF